MEINQVLRWDRKFIHTRNCVYIYMHMRKSQYFFPNKILTLETEKSWH